MTILIIIVAVVLLLCVILPPGKEDLGVDIRDGHNIAYIRRGEMYQAHIHNRSWVLLTKLKCDDEEKLKEMVEQWLEEKGDGS